MTTDKIFFYSPADEWGWMSNFARIGFEGNPHYYKTVEHFYQSQKHVGTPTELRIIQAHSPKEAARIGRTTDMLCANWNDVRLMVMRQGLFAKFSANPTYLKRLLATEDKLIYENSPNDYVWGIGKIGKGFNWLGRLIMEIRSKFQGIPPCPRCNRNVEGNHLNLRSEACL